MALPRPSTRCHASLIALLAPLLAITAMGCARDAVRPTQVAAPAPNSAAQELPPLEGESGPVERRESPRRVGDVFVHRFSGSYRSNALTLREEVIDERDELLLVDYILEEGDTVTHLRAEMTKQSERIISVLRVENGDIIPGSLDDLESMLKKTTFTPDQNRGRVSQADQTCLVGKDELSCELSEYRVYLQGQEAKLTVARTPEMKRDISGEITAVDGTVLYHAELIEMQRGEEPTATNEHGVALHSPAARSSAVRSPEVNFDERN